ncbi:Pyrophosphate--fructose 6-phosphate 1-phosphotransferase [Alphaproteobacteria bacterium SO-S41]|nr:Pyrophosphate--fructose 6-phosphate 1-phosphotransferase [Alphaproteobacteria bacterium SO-S41]
MRIGLLTGGGDVPGLNVAIKTVVREATLRGWTVQGLRRGWEALLRLDADDPGTAAWLTTLTPERVRTIDRTGGTILHTSRVNPASLPIADLPPHHAAFATPGAKTIDATPIALKAIEALGIDALIAIGGDGTLRFGARLAKEGVPIVTFAKTMDNDVHGTDVCIGFSTAITRSVDAITALRTTAGSHERVLVVELFGRRSGETALLAGLLADADRTLIAETPVDPARLAELIAGDWRANPSRYAVVVAAEGAKLVGGEEIEHGAPDAYGRRRLGGIGEVLGEEIKSRTGLDTIVQRLAYMMRSGPPDSFDRMLANAYATFAVELIAARQFGKFCAVQGGRYVALPADTPAHGARQVDVASLYDDSEYRPRITGIAGRAAFLS